MNERAGGDAIGGGASQNDGGWPKTSIGNYKGVMLCNRPADLGQPKVIDYGQEGKPFLSRVMPDEGMGWNPPKRPMIKLQKKRDPNSALVKHKQFLKKLEQQKMLNREMEVLGQMDKAEKTKKFKETTAN